MRRTLEKVRAWLWAYFLGDDPTFGTALVPLCFLSILLFTRHPIKTNFIFDEQEALLANPYVRSVADAHPKFHWLDAFRRDFWGLPADHSIGSYRPLPDILWRGLWAIGARDQTPFLHHWVNVLLHGINGALVTLLVFRVTKKRGAAWLAGAIFVSTAVLTEAVTGVVGTADVLGGTGALLALMSLALPMALVPFAIFGATLFGLYSKESALSCVPLVPYAALLVSPILHPGRHARWVRAGLAFLGTFSAFIFYVEVRRRMFPITIPPELTAEANAHKGALARTFATLLRWYAQPPLPHDPLNNPLVDASTPYRIAGALRVYARGLFEVLLPTTLSGDYSAPQEPIPPRLIFPESILGALAGIIPVLVSLLLSVWIVTRRKAEFGTTRFARRVLVAIGLMWIVVCYFPVSNIPVVLPTVRAERFWYFPVIATSVLLALAWDGLLVWAKARGAQAFAISLLAFFLVLQATKARAHANDYVDDLTFWNATRHAVPRSAKAHLNYSVMQGARGNLVARLESNRVALELAPQWPMANVYLGDTLCRMHRPFEAWPHYARGFELAPNDVNLIALAIQCLWDEHALVAPSTIPAELEALAEKFPGSWLEYLERDTRDNGAAYNGVDPKYRPRGYNEGPKKE